MKRRCVTVEVGTGLAKWPGFWTYWTQVPDLEEGDWVVLPPVRPEEDDAPIIGRVVDPKPGQGPRKRATKWIVCHVDMDVHRALTALAPAEPEDVTS